MFCECAAALQRDQLSTHHVSVLKTLEIEHRIICVTYRRLREWKEGTLKTYTFQRTIRDGFSALGGGGWKMQTGRFLFCFIPQTKITPLSGYG